MFLCENSFLLVFSLLLCLEKYSCNFNVYVSEHANANLTTAQMYKRGPHMHLRASTGCYRRFPNMDTVKAMGLEGIVPQSWKEGSGEQVSGIGSDDKSCPEFKSITLKQLPEAIYDELHNTDEAYIIDVNIIDFNLQPQDRPGFSFSVVSWKNRPFSCGRITAHNNKGSPFHLTKDHIGCSWDNIIPRYSFLHYPNTSRLIYGEDPRLIVATVGNSLVDGKDPPRAFRREDSDGHIKHKLNQNNNEDTLFLVFNTINKTEFASRRMVLAELTVHDSDAHSPAFPANHKIEIRNLYYLFAENYVSRQQKNWTPFVYKRNVFFVYNIYPHTIVALSNYSSHYAPPRSLPENTLTAKFISISMVQNLTWSYGELRGGT